jgi:predicted TIM-barrel enzyme
MMAEAGADIISPHVGLTSGGLIGAKEVPNLDEACEKLEAMCEAARAVRSDVIVLAHGGPFEDPGSVQVAFERTPVDGYLGASTIERLPVERAIKNIVQEFHALKLGGRQPAP